MRNTSDNVTLATYINRIIVSTCKHVNQKFQIQSGLFRKKLHSDRKRRFMLGIIAKGVYVHTCLDPATRVSGAFLTLRLLLVDNNKGQRIRQLCVAQIISFK